MKNIFTLIFMSLIYISALSQDNVGNFKKVRDGIVWECTFVDSLHSSNEIKNIFLLSDYLEDIREVDSVIAANVKKWKPNYKDAGYSYMNIPLYVSRSGGFSGSVKIFIQDNQYKVVFSNIVINSNPSDALFRTEMNFDEVAYNFKKGMFRKQFAAVAGFLKIFFFQKY